MKQALNANIVNRRAPVVQSLKMRSEPLAFAKLDVVGHQVAADRNVPVKQLKFGDLLKWIVTAIQKYEVNLEIRTLFGYPPWNHVLRKTKKRSEAMHRFRSAGKKV